MEMTDSRIRNIISEMLKDFEDSGNACQVVQSDQWLCDTVDEAVDRAKASQKALVDMSLEKRGQLIDAMRRASLEEAEVLARLAHEETGYGVVEDKIAKNKLAAEKTPGIEDLTAEAYSGDFGLTLVEGAPYGVIGSITPSTNPTSTVINNSISMIAAGNGVVYNPHPAAKKASQAAMGILNRAIAQAGGPKTLITTVKEPNLASGKAIMIHPDIPILSITGGEAVVNVAMKCGKKVIAAGPGNPPVIVDNTADIPKAAKDIVDGASFDNNVLCIAEKEVFAFEDIQNDLIRHMEASGAWQISGREIEQVVRTVLVKKDDTYVVNRAYVGKPATKILKDAGIAFKGNPKLVIAKVDKYHPFVMVEMLMPVLGICSVSSIEEAIYEAIRAESGCKHTAMIHSTNIKHLSVAAKALNTSIFVKNAPSYAGLGFTGEGYTTLTISTPTGEGLTSAKTFTRSRRCVLHGDFRIV